MARTKNDELLDKLPHRGSMRLLDSVVSVDDREVETETRIDALRASLFGYDGKVESYLGIELIAQSAAMPLIFAAEEGKEHAGMIVQVRSFRSYGDAIAGYPVLRTRCEVELMLDGKVASVKGSVFHEEAKVCDAVLTLAVGGS